MQEFIEIAKVDGFKPGTMRMVIIGGHEYL